MESFNHFFASANTALGFQNNFKYINNENKNGYLYILKGGPGTGKSTLLKTIANHFEKIGEKVEYFHCSSDAKSLDGVRLIRKNISIVDGTAPHIIETTIPNIKEEIIDLGAHIGDEVRKHEEDIKNYLGKKSGCYKLAYNYLKALSPIFENKIILEKNSLVQNNNAKLLKGLILRRKDYDFFPRELFLTHFSSEGIKELNNGEFKTITLGTNFYQDNITLKELQIKLTEQKISYISCPNLIDLNYLDSLIIPTSKTIIKTSSPYHSKDRDINFLINSLTKLAGKAIEEAIIYHKEVEKFYIKSMDFKSINKLTKNLIKKIEKQN